MEVLERIVGAEDGTDHYEDSRGKHAHEDNLAVQGDSEFEEERDWDQEDANVRSARFQTLSGSPVS